jgi:hypothetical protein
MIDETVTKDNGPLSNALLKHLEEYYYQINKDKSTVFNTHEEYYKKQNGRHTQQEATSTDDRQNQPSS